MQATLFFAKRANYRSFSLSLLPAKLLHFSDLQAVITGKVVVFSAEVAKVLVRLFQ